MVDLATSLVVRRKDDTMTPFRRDQLFVSILQAVGHRDESIMDAGALTATITAKLIDSAKSAALGTGDITRTALQTLERFDSAAAVQYAAYHKN
jgi:transcriptional regulator NrdR family protein